MKWQWESTIFLIWACRSFVIFLVSELYATSTMSSQGLCDVSPPGTLPAHVSAAKCCMTSARVKGEGDSNAWVAARGWSALSNCNGSTEFAEVDNVVVGRKGAGVVGREEEEGLDGVVRAEQLGAAVEASSQASRAKSCAFVSISAWSTLAQAIVPPATLLTTSLNAKRQGSRAVVARRRNGMPGMLKPPAEAGLLSVRRAGVGIEDSPRRSNGRARGIPGMCGSGRFNGKYCSACPLAELCALGAPRALAVPSALAALRELRAVSGLDCLKSLEADFGLFAHGSQLLESLERSCARKVLWRCGSTELILTVPCRGLA